MLLGTLALALAGTPVLHGPGVGGAALHDTSERLGVPEGDLDPVDVGRWVRPDGGWLGAQARGCERDAVPVSRVEDAVQVAVAHLDRGDLSEAHHELNSAWDALVCLDAPVPPELAHRVQFLLGVGAVYEGRDVLARDHFLVARRFAPNLPWDDDFAPRGRAIYEVAVPQGGLRGEPVRALLPVDGFVDGQAWDGASTEVVPGEHLVQLRDGDQVRGFLVDVQAPALLVPPRLDSGQVLGWTADEPEPLARLVIAGLPGEESAYVHAPSGVFRLSIDPPELVRLPDPVPPGRRRWGPLVMASGTAVAGAGAVIGTLGWVQAEQSASAAGVWASAPTVPGAEGAYQDAELQYLNTLP